jgi:hypothetical protein
MMFSQRRAKPLFESPAKEPIEPAETALQSRKLESSEVRSQGQPNFVLRRRAGYVRCTTVDAQYWRMIRFEEGPEDLRRAALIVGIQSARLNECDHEDMPR